ncbi:MAG TPA: Uma2 family endonuclease [Tepidisphaeraceae bacterium]|jgi:Uma2 family endonuclease
MGKTVDNFPARASRRGEPPWELTYGEQMSLEKLATLPLQGDWTVDDYLALPEDGRMIEFNEGMLEFVPMPDWMHQELSALLWQYLRSIYIDGKKGRAVLPPFFLQTAGLKYREPDVMFLAPKNLRHFDRKKWRYADLVVEIISASDPDRDDVDKRVEYAVAGLPEYWLIDPDAETIEVLTLDAAGAYHGPPPVPLAGVVRSVTIPEIVVDFADLLRQVRESENIQP